VFGLCEHLQVTTAELIVRARQRRKMSPAELARRLGVSRSTIHAWEHGGPGPKLDHIVKLADVLEVQVASLIGEAKAS